MTSAEETSRPAARATRPDVRAALVEAAWWVLEHEGEAGLTVRAVATRAGVAPMGVYNHLRDKEGLLRAVLTRGFDEFAAALDVGRGSDPVERLTATGRAYREFALAHPVAYSLMFGGRQRRMTAPPDAEAVAAEVDPEERLLLEAGARAFARLVDVVELGQAAGRLRAGPPEALGWSAWSAVHGAVSLELASGLDPVAAGVAYEDVLAMVTHGLAP